MTLKDACGFGIACGLNTVGESVFNIDIHSISIFSYDEISKELNELYSEFNPEEKDLPILEKFPELALKEDQYEDYGS